MEARERVSDHRERKRSVPEAGTPETAAQDAEAKRRQISDEGETAVRSIRPQAQYYTHPPTNLGASGGRSPPCGG
jgi:hypothetical protein